MKILMIGLALAASVSLVTVVKAQDTPADTSLVSALHEAVARESHLRLLTPDTVEGRIVAFTDGMVRFRSGDTVAVESIRQLEVGSTRNIGILIGAAAGAFVLGPTISYFLLGDSGVKVGGVSLAGLASGGLIGALAGGAIWPAKTKWRTTWTTPGS